MVDDPLKPITRLYRNLRYLENWITPPGAWELIFAAAAISLSISIFAPQAFWTCFKYGTYYRLTLPFDAVIIVWLGWLAGREIY